MLRETLLKLEKEINNEIKGKNANVRILSGGYTPKEGNAFGTEMIEPLLIVKGNQLLKLKTAGYFISDNIPLENPPDREIIKNKILKEVTGLI